MSQPRLTTAFLPELIADNQLFGRTAVIVDILRASTTITHALANKAAAVVPCLEVDQARAAAAEINDTRVLLGGERGGLRVEGFDLGNSPADYDEATVAGATIVFSTTNGTRAIERCRDVAKRIVVGCFANLSTVADEVAEDEVAIICAGTNGEVTREDVLFAGALAESLRSRNPGLTMDDCSLLAASAWGEISDSDLAKALEKSLGGRNLGRIGQKEDIKLASRVDSHPCLPIFRGSALELYTC